MKKLILLLTVLISFNASAEKTSGMCKGIESLSRVIMDNRQNNVSLSAMLGAISNDGSDKGITKKIILDAYESGAYRSPANKQNAIDKFANKWALQCYKEL